MRTVNNIVSMERRVADNKAKMAKCEERIIKLNMYLKLLNIALFTMPFILAATIYFLFIR